MRKSLLLATAAFLAVALGACSGGTPALPNSPVTSPQSNYVADGCAVPDTSIAEAPHCYAVHRIDVGAAAPGGYTGLYVIPGVTRVSELRTALSRSAAASGTPSGYGPADLASAYALPTTTAGSGQTVGIVDYGNDPNVESDLGVYRSTYGLPPCTTANGCFKKVNESGVQGSYPKDNRSWSGEISLDVDMVSAVCPNCKIVLVEVSKSFNNGENTAINLGANVVSNSYGASLAAGYNAAFDHPGHILTVASGDSGYSSSTTYPDGYGTVVSVGGTTLKKASNTRGWTETTWSGSTSECSTGVAKPAWQKDTGCSARTETDVSAVSDPNTGLAVYLTYGGNGWTVYGGTSAASPILAGVYALAGNEASLTYAQSVYTNASKLNDVTSGSNGSCAGYLCNAGTGYDGPTGNGTPNGLGAF
ncbi:MAG TPA: S53 family peptidase [Candidatus Baltobacteraceae bacterium]|nr:S53 family peptidase [Candidatus Baltobacteraceae bacterium]